MSGVNLGTPGVPGNVPFFTCTACGDRFHAWLTWPFSSRSSWTAWCNRPTRPERGTRQWWISRVGGREGWTRYVQLLLLFRMGLFSAVSISPRCLQTGAGYQVAPRPFLLIAPKTAVWARAAGLGGKQRRQEGCCLFLSLTNTYVNLSSKLLKLVMVSEWAHIKNPDHCLLCLASHSLMVPGIFAVSRTCFCPWWGGRYNLGSSAGC